MKLCVTFLLTLLTGLISGCEYVLQSEAETGDHSKILVVEDTDSMAISIRLGERVILPEQELDILFKDVTSDSRCPEDVVCFWQGNAELMLLMKDQKKSLNTTLDPSIISTGRYQIKIAELHPHTHSEKVINKKDYWVLLSIEMTE